MNPLIQLKQTSSVFFVAFGLAYFGLSPPMQALSPAPDGGYLGGNTAEGQYALFSLTTGGYNTAVGFLSLDLNRTNSLNMAVGAGTLLCNTADKNTATDAGALLSNTTGTQNTANGAFALFSNTLGNQNVANGNGALFVNTGNDNTAIGFAALSGNTTGNNNIALGANAGINVGTASNVICIGTDGVNADNSCFIGQIFGATSSGGIPVLINSDGRLGAVPSSRQFQDEIKPVAQASEALFALKPVTFRYKKKLDPAGTAQFGLIAEEVEKVNPDLVVRGKEGNPYGVRYDQVNAMLLKKFLKEHKAFVEEQGKVQEQGATIVRLPQQIEALTAGLQKVSA